MSIVVVLVKRSRLDKKSQLNFHSFKCHGGLLNTTACHGRGHYVRRVVEQDQQHVLETLHEIAQRVA